MRILCIGDSNTWGYDPVTGLRLQNRWTKVLAKLLPEDEIIEEGLNGRTLISQDNEKRERCGVDSLKMILMSHQPVDLVVLMLGTNDLKRVFNGNAAYIASGVREYIKIINNPYQWERYYVPKLLVVSPILLDENVRENALFGEFDDNSVLESRKMSTTIFDICDKYSVNFMDASDYAKASKVDGVHMDEDNHSKLAEGIFENIKKIF